MPAQVRPASPSLRYCINMKFIIDIVCSQIVEQRKVTKSCNHLHQNNNLLSDVLHTTSLLRGFFAGEGPP